MSIRDGWLKLIKHTLNPVTLRAARRGSTRFSLVRHVGRKTGRQFESVIIVAPVAEGFVAELTYGPEVAWYRNAVAAGHCQIVRLGKVTDIGAIEPLDAARGRAAYGPPESWVLRLLRRNDFVLLRATGVAETGTLE